MIRGLVKTSKLKINSFSFLIIILIVFLIKSFLVQWSYNTVMPKLISNITGTNENFRRLSYLEAIVVVILFNNLFNR